MTIVSPQAAEESSTRSVWLGAAMTTAVVAAGTAVALGTVPAAPTPANVARAFIEARLGGDAQEAWNLLCRESRSLHGGYSSFAERVALTNLSSSFPTEISVDVREVLVQPKTPLEVDVGGVVTSGERDDDWRQIVWLELREQDGQFQVCGDGGWVR